MSGKSKDCLFLAAALVLSALLWVSALLIFGAVSPSPLPIRTIETKEGALVNASSITDVTGCHVLEAVNYTADRYVVPSPENIGQTQDALYHKGTYQFLITNLDPLDEAFDDKARYLERFKGTDDNWHLTLYLPPVLSACTVYVRARLVAGVGELSGYRYNDYTTSPLTETEKHMTGTRPLLIDLTLYSERKFLAPDSPVQNGVYVTVHYESPQAALGGIDGQILIGEDAAVRAAVTRNDLSVYVVAICAIVVFAVLLFVSVLKRRLDFIGQIVLALGIFGIMFFGYLYTGSCSAPYLIKAFCALSYGLILLGGAATAERSYKRFPLKIPLLTLAAVVCLMAFAAPLCPAGAYRTLVLLYTVVSGVLLAAIPLSAVLSVLSGAKKELYLGVMCTPALIGAALFSPGAVAAFSPVFFLCVSLLAVIACISFREFALTEKRYAYLTANLQAEVSRQTTELKNVISERDKLLRYLSHDLKKTVTGMKRFLAPLRSMEDPCARSLTVDNIENKIENVEESLQEIQKFAKTNYAAERSTVCDLDGILKSVFDDLDPDCQANSIRLKFIPTRLLVFAKPVALSSVIHNLVFNAIDHADCSQIILSAVKEKDTCLITVTDNGKGIDPSQELFVPYQTRSDSQDNLGLGLYICKQFILSMGGDLTYRRIDGNTVFTVFLPIA